MPELMNLDIVKEVVIVIISSMIGALLSAILIILAGRRLYDLKYNPFYSITIIGLIVLELIACLSFILLIL